MPGLSRIGVLVSFVVLAQCTADASHCAPSTCAGAARWDPSRCVCVSGADFNEELDAGQAEGDASDSPRCDPQTCAGAAAWSATTCACELAADR